MSGPAPDRGLPRRVFLVGCPRSGTTLLQSLLAAHPDIASFPESHFFTHAVSWRAWRRRLGLAAPRARGRLRQYVREIGEPDLGGEIPRWSPLLRAHVIAFAAIMDGATRRRGKPLWLEKTPDHLFFIDVIGEHLGAVDFLHLLRRGTDVVASLYEVTRRYPEQWEGPWSLDQCIGKWTSAASISIAAATRPGHLLVTYERLIAAAPEVLERICGFLDLPFREAMLRDRPAAADSLILNEPWKQMVRADVQAPAGRFLTVFTPDQQAYVRERIDPVQAAVTAATDNARATKSHGSSQTGTGPDT